MRPTLSPATLGRLPLDVLRPAFDRAAVRTGIVHLGVAFHRAHQAVYTDAVLAAGDTRWGTSGASLRSPETSLAGPQRGAHLRRRRSMPNGCLQARLLSY